MISLRVSYVSDERPFMASCVHPWQGPPQDIITGQSLYLQAKRCGQGSQRGPEKSFRVLHVHRTNAQAWPTARVRHGPRWRSEVVARLGTCLGHEDAERMAGRVGEDIQRLLGVVGPVEQHPRAQPFRAMSLALQLFR